MQHTQDIGLTKGKTMKTLNEVIKFAFYDEQTAREFYGRRVSIFKNDVSDLNIYQTPKGWIVEVNV